MSKKEDVFATIDEAIKLVREGKMLIVVDSPDRENEGDLFIAAEKTNADDINFMTKHGRGLLCVSLASEITESLGLSPMSYSPTDPHGTGWMMSVDAEGETTTGISTYDRARTVEKLISEDSRSSDFTKPGHVFPLKAKPGGVLERSGHTEAAADLAKIAGLKPAGVIIEVLSDDGTMARLPKLTEMAKKWDVKVVTIEDIIKYRLKRENLVKRVAEVNLPTSFGNFKILGYETKNSGEQHVALVKGDVGDGEDILVRVHSECLTGDTFRSLKCDCGAQMRAALRRIEEEGRGVFLYILGHEGRGIGLLNKLKAMELQQKGYDTVQSNRELGYEADLRDYGIGAQILRDIGVRSMRLLTNNPKKISGLKGYGLEVKERTSLNVGQNENNTEYLKTKRDKLGHSIELEKQ